MILPSETRRRVGARSGLRCGPGSLSTEAPRTPRGAGATNTDPSPQRHRRHGRRPAVAAETSVRLSPGSLPRSGTRVDHRRLGTAEGIPLHGGTDGAEKLRRKYGRPLAETELEGRACQQAKRWGECPADRRSAAPVASSLSARSARLTSCPRRRPQNTTPRWVKKKSKKSNRVKKLCRRGDTGDATRPTGEHCADAQ